jgi:SAM-dependent methyltransferase
MLCPRMTVPRAAASPAPVRDAAVRLLDGTATGRALDAPCGTGLLAVELARRGFTVLGLDADPAAARAAGVSAVSGDLEEDLPFATASFDLAVCLEGIEHVEGQARLLREFARVLKPGGVLVLSTPNVSGRPSRRSLLHKGYARFFRPAPEGHAFPFEHAHRHPIDVVRLDFLLREAGFRPEAFDGDAGPAGSPSPWRRLLRRLAARPLRKHNPRADLLLHPAVFHSRVVAVRARRN